MAKILNGHSNSKLVPFDRAYNPNRPTSGFFRFLQGAALLVTATLLSACLAGGGGGGDPATTTGAPPPPPPPVVVLPPGAAVACLPDARADYLVANYYVDAATGLDGNNGLTPGTAWQTLARALAAPAPAVIHVKAGSYGVLTETTPVARGGYLTIRPDPLAAPGSVILTGINIQYAGPAKSPARLRVIGFTIKPDYDPPAAIVNFKNATELELHNNTISTIKYAKATAIPGNPAMFDGLSFFNTDAILVKSNKITDVFRGILLDGSSNSAMKCNYISTENGSAILYLSLNSNALIEDNHIRGGANVLFPGDPDAPDSPHAHASIISIRSENVTIRNNIMHGMGSTSAIRFYFPDVTGGLNSYSNITIEGNSIYDVEAATVLQLINAGSNVIVRNNVIVSHYRKWTPPSTLCADGNTPDARYRYEQAIEVTAAAGFTGSGISIINNIFVGLAFFPATVNERNNIIWSYSPDGTFPATTPSGTSMVITSSYLDCGNHSTFFETGFFAAAPNYEPDHNLVINYKPAPASAAVNFGNESLQLQRALGTLDASDVFVSTIVGRAPGQRSAGPYEP